MEDWYTSEWDSQLDTLHLLTTLLDLDLDTGIKQSLGYVVLVLFVVSLSMLKGYWLESTRAVVIIIYRATECLAFVYLIVHDSADCGFLVIYHGHGVSFSWNL